MNHTYVFMWLSNSQCVLYKQSAYYSLLYLYHFHSIYDSLGVALQYAYHLDHKPCSEEALFCPCKNNLKLATGIFVFKNCVWGKDWTASMYMLLYALYVVGLNSFHIQIISSIHNTCIYGWKTDFLNFQLPLFENDAETEHLSDIHVCLTLWRCKRNSFLRRMGIRSKGNWKWREFRQDLQALFKYLHVTAVWTYYVPMSHTSNCSQKCICTWKALKASTYLFYTKMANSGQITQPSSTISLNSFYQRQHLFESSMKRTIQTQQREETCVPVNHRPMKTLTSSVFWAVPSSEAVVKLWKPDSRSSRLCWLRLSNCWAAQTQNISEQWEFEHRTQYCQHDNFSGNPVQEILHYCMIQQEFR